MGKRTTIAEKILVEAIAKAEAWSLKMRTDYERAEAVVAAHRETLAALTASFAPKPRSNGTAKPSKKAFRELDGGVSKMRCAAVLAGHNDPNAVCGELASNIIHDKYGG